MPKPTQRDIIWFVCGTGLSIAVGLGIWAGTIQANLWNHTERFGHGGIEEFIRKDFSIVISELATIKIQVQGLRDEVKELKADIRERRRAKIQR